MKGCTCRGGLTLCVQCAALAARAGIVASPAAPIITERAFMQAVRKVAEAHGWEIMHIYDSRKSTGVGWPDLVCARPPYALFCELKVDAPLTLQQEHWLDVLRQVRHTETYLWTPGQMPQIIARLTS